MTRLYNQKKHEQAKADHEYLTAAFWNFAKFDFMMQDVELNDEVDE